MDQPRAGLLLGSPLGRRFLAGRHGFSFGKILSEQPGLGQLAWGAPLTAGQVSRGASWDDVRDGWTPDDPVNVTGSTGADS